ncbi:MAG: DAK2 domain-containing protein [Dehalococcoidia bacterium]
MNKRLSGTQTPAALDGAALRVMMQAATAALEANREQINALNVFPVPDGDTGTNMHLTMLTVVEEAVAAANEGAGDTANGMARSALLGARGNSGLILAQFFRGLADALATEHFLFGHTLATALRKASDRAYSSVPDPKEGTMLTVFRECAEALEKNVRHGQTIEEAWTIAVDQTRDTVARTPSMLDVLREAGVVDSGGHGFSVMLSGALQALRGEGDGSAIVAAPAPEGMDALGDGVIRAGFFESVQEEIWGYCTVFAIEGQSLNPDAVRAEIAHLGKSAVVAGDSQAVKVHIHMQDPGQAISYGTSLGTLSHIDIKNMDEQAHELAATQRKQPVPAFEASVVAVAAGDGLVELFRSTGLGACSIVPGGDSMNPSTRDLLEAVERSPCDKVILLPNNKNIMGTAEQVDELTEKQVVVVPTRSIQAGVAALLAYSPDATLEDNVREMQQAASAVRSGAVFKATRDVTSGDLQVKTGEYTALLDEEICGSGDDPESVLISMLDGQVPPDSLVTIYWGDGIEADAANETCERVRSCLPGAEVELVPGGQQHYEYLVSIE